MFTIVTENHTDTDGNPSKKITIADDTDIITLKLGAVEAGQLAAALRPNGKNVKIEGGRRD